MTEPLSDEELERLRALLTADSRRQWLISAIAGVAKYIAILSAGWLAARGILAEALPWLK